MIGSPHLLLAWSAFLIASLLCLKAVATSLPELRKTRHRDWFYKDCDGDGTPETIAKFSNRRNKTAIILSSTLGSLTSITIFILSLIKTDDPGQRLETGLVASSWVRLKTLLPLLPRRSNLALVILVYGVCIAITQSSIKAYNLGLWLLPSSLMLFLASLSQSLQHASNLNFYKCPTNILWIISDLSSVLLALSSITLPRRVDVAVEGCAVDRQRTVSAICRHTWSWIEPMLKQASIKGDLEPNDLFYPDHSLRSGALQQKWDNRKCETGLMRSLFETYKIRLGASWIVTILRCGVSILPFWTFRQVLDILETHHGRSIHHIELLILIIGMAISGLLDAWMEGWLFWYSISALSLPIRAQLSSLIFAKSLRRKDIKAICKIRQSNKQQNIQPEVQSDPSLLDGDINSSPQGVVNLVAVDTERIAYFAQFQFMIISTMAKLSIFSVFLIQIMGWMPFVAGISAWLLVVPASAWASNLLLAQSKILMQLRDAKLSNLNEALLGIRQIKLSALEPQWETKLLALRKMELQALWKYFVADSALSSCWILSQVLLAGTSLAAYVLVHGTLSPSVAFVSLGMFSTLEGTLETLPELISMAVDTLVSIRRVDIYLADPDIRNNTNPGPSISFQNATISWPMSGLSLEDGRFTLRSLDFCFPVDVLSVITGHTGSGKSLVIAAILGEADLMEGSVFVPDTPAPSRYDTRDPEDWIIPGFLAYVSQTPWLDNGSLRDNVLFGLHLVKERYVQVIEACALKPDLDTLIDGDSTELGANGVNLSGGQKWRVALARAIYSTAEILVMEDIFCAVDAHVGRWILEKCINGSLCKGRTRILVTHSMGPVLSCAAYVVELEGGTVTYSGPPLVHTRGDTKSDSIISADATENIGEEHGAANGLRPISQTKGARRFLLEEGRNVGKVQSRVYFEYLKHSGGTMLWVICTALFLILQISILGRAWWIHIWTSQEDSSDFTSKTGIQQFIMPPMVEKKHSQSHDLSHLYDKNVFFYLTVYILISIAMSVIGIVRYFSVYVLAIKAGKKIFHKMLFTVLHAPLQWLDSVPTGRIINRFTTDLNVIDQRLPMSWILFLTSLLRLVGICLASLFTCSYLICPAMILFILGSFVGSRYLKASRPLKRLESVARSPIFDLFNTTLEGISTIRAYKKSLTYMVHMHRLVDEWTMATFYVWLANRWMSFRMALLAAAFCIAVGLIVVFDTSIDPSLAGFVLSFVLDFSESMRWTVRCYGDMELDMNSMERAEEYMRLGTESMCGNRPPASWPTVGDIEFRKVDVAHGPHMPLVLKDISFKIRHKGRVAVVGRTGAGKSSLALTLFRCLHMRGGTIIIDGLDISNLTLHDLRSRLAIIPQDPVLFSGTIRSNLDPFSEYTDSELIAALVQVQLVRNQPAIATSHQEVNVSNPSIDFSNLSSPISESGGNLSHGQRQLLSIARAIISRPKIIVFDEATSAVDCATDALVQQSIRSSFVDSTLLIIAHRLSTICDFDNIVVLNRGHIEEFGSPLELWEKNGMFRAMCESSSENERKKLENSIFGPELRE